MTMSVTIQVALAVQRRGPNRGPLGVPNIHVMSKGEERSQGIRQEVRVDEDRKRSSKEAKREESFEKE